MNVFNLPSYPYVFKVIRDVFGPGKNTDRETVKRKFLMVKEVDRVGQVRDQELPSQRQESMDEAALGHPRPVPVEEGSVG